MSKAAPWIKFFAGDFLNGVADLQADEIGAYTVILALIWDRGAPIADDAAWLARRAGMSTRRFNQVRAKLIADGKLEARNGLLGNKRAIAEVEARDRKSDQARNAALSRWHGHNEPELPLGDDAEDYLGKNPRKNRQTTQEQIDLKTPKNAEKPQKSANPDNADASFPSRARAFQRPESRIKQPNDSPDSPARDPEPEAPALDHRDLTALLAACSDASGFNHVTPGTIARELDIVKSWREAGIDFEKVVLPTIRSIIAKSSDPTSSLKRFDRQVRLEHAKASAAAKSNGSRPYSPPASPILDFEGEGPIMRKIRDDLLAHMGPVLYCHAMNSVRLEPVTDLAEGDNRTPLRVIDNRHGSLSVMNGSHATIVRAIARKHGFSTIW